MKRKVAALFYTIVTFIAIFATGGIYIRFVNLNVQAYNIDPETAPSTGKPNEYRLVGNNAQIFNQSASELSQLMHKFVEGQPRTEGVVASSDEAIFTYVQRTPIMGYPDYITIMIIPEGTSQSKLVIFSRSRFGHSDFGVNKRRIDEWVAAIQGLVAG